MNQTINSYYINQLIDYINSGLVNENIHIKLDYEYEHIMPKLQKKNNTILYSRRYEIYTFLFLNGNFEIVLDYFFAIESFINRQYTISSFFLKSLKRRMRMCSLLMNIKSLCRTDLHKYMLQFTILHEIAHAIYNSKEELKEEAFKIIDEDLSRFKKNIKRDIGDSIYNKDLKKKQRVLETKIGVKNIATEMTVDKLKSQLEFDETIIQNIRHKEELACDLYSLCLSIQLFEDNKDKKSILNFYKASMSALALATRYNYLLRRYVKMQDDERYSKNNDAELLRIFFYLNECIFGALSRNIRTKDFYNYTKQLTCDWLHNVVNYINSNLDIISKQNNVSQCEDQHQKDLLEEEILCFEDKFVSKWLS